MHQLHSGTFLFDLPFLGKCTRHNRNLLSVHLFVPPLFSQPSETGSQVRENHFALVLGSSRKVKRKGQWEWHCLFPLLILFCGCLTLVQPFEDDTFLPTSFLGTADVQVGSQLTGIAVKQSRYSHMCEQCMGLHKLCSLKCARVDLLWVNLMVSGESWGKASHAVILFSLGEVVIFKPWKEWLASA